MHDKVVGGVQKGSCACMCNWTGVVSVLTTAGQVKYLFLSVQQLTSVWKALYGSKVALLCLTHKQNSAEYQIASLTSNVSAVALEPGRTLEPKPYFSRYSMAKMGLIDQWFLGNMWGIIVPAGTGNM